MYHPVPHVQDVASGTGCQQHLVCDLHDFLQAKIQLTRYNISASAKVDKTERRLKCGKQFADQPQGYVEFNSFIRTSTAPPSFKFAIEIKLSLSVFRCLWNLWRYRSFFSIPMYVTREKREPHEENGKHCLRTTCVRLCVCMCVCVSVFVRRHTMSIDMKTWVSDLKLI